MHPGSNAHFLIQLHIEIYSCQKYINNYLKMYIDIIKQVGCGIRTTSGCAWSTQWPRAKCTASEVKHLDIACDWTHRTLR